MGDKYYLEIRRGEYADDLEVDVGLVTPNGVHMTTHKGSLAQKLYLSLLNLNIVPPKKEFLKSNN